MAGDVEAKVLWTMAQHLHTQHGMTPAQVAEELDIPLLAARRAIRALDRPNRRYRRRDAQDGGFTPPPEPPPAEPDDPNRKPKLPPLVPRF